MAKLDNFLRSSGLRLREDGTCRFSFDSRTFIVRTITDCDRKDFLLCCNLGKLRDLRERYFGRKRSLFKMMALWNEELQLDRKDSGILRVDSSKEETYLSFSYYGAVDEILSEDDFQDMLDQFVDDALDMFERLRNCDAGDDPLSVDSQMKTHLVDCKSSGKSFSQMSCSTATTASTQSSGSSCYRNNEPSGKMLRRASSSLTSTSEMYPTSHCEESEDKMNSEPKRSSILSKVMSNLCVKPEPAIISKAFIDPSNPAAAFVVDRKEIEEPIRHFQRRTSTKCIERKASELRVLSSKVNSIPQGPTHLGRARSFHLDVDNSTRHISSCHQPRRVASIRHVSFQAKPPPCSSRRSSLPTRPGLLQTKSSLTSVLSDPTRKAKSYYQTSAGVYARP